MHVGQYQANQHAALPRPRFPSLGRSFTSSAGSSGVGDVRNLEFEQFGSPKQQKLLTELSLTLAYLLYVQYCLPSLVCLDRVAYGLLTSMQVVFVKRSVNIKGSVSSHFSIFTKEIINHIPFSPVFSAQTVNHTDLHLNVSPLCLMLNSCPSLHILKEASSRPFHIQRQ